MVGYGDDLDKVEEKILGELDANARQSEKQIASTIGSSRQVVNYRVNKLIDKGIITNFYTNINVGKLGLKSYYVYLQFSGTNKEQEQTLFKHITDLDFTGWLVSGVGRWDAVTLIFAKSSAMFERLLSELISECDDYLQDYSFTTLVEAEHISYKFLNQDGAGASQTDKTEQISLDGKDLRVLDAVSQDARITVTDIASEQGLEPHVVRYRLKKLKETVIEGFKPKIDVHKLGFQWHLLLLQFQVFDEDTKRSFLSYCRDHKNVYYVANTLGTYNVMLDIHVQDTRAFKDVLLDLKQRYSGLIKRYESMVIFNEHKISYFPRKLIDGSRDT